MWLNYYSHLVSFELWRLETHNTRKLLTSAYLSLSEVMGTSLIKRLRMCDCIFIQIYDRILCIIQSPCLIITDSNFSSNQISSTNLTYCSALLPFTILHHNLPDNNPTLIPYNSQIFPVSSSCHSTKCWKGFASITLKLRDKTPRLSFRVKYL